MQIAEVVLSLLASEAELNAWSDQEGDHACSHQEPEESQRQGAKEAVSVSDRAKKGKNGGRTKGRDGEQGSWRHDCDCSATSFRSRCVEPSYSFNRAVIGP